MDHNWLQAFGGWVVPIVVALLGWLYQTRKVKVEESDIILSRWKDFSDTHTADMKRMREENHADRARLEEELSAVRAELKEVRAEFAIFRREAEDQIRIRDQEIAGLKRTISQISQSTAVQIGRSRDMSDRNRSAIEILEAKQETPPAISDSLEKLKRIGGNSEKGEKDVG